MKSEVLSNCVANLRNRRNVLRWIFIIPVGLLTFAFFFNITQVSNMTPEEKAASIERRAEAVRIKENENVEGAATELLRKE